MDLEYGKPRLIHYGPIDHDKKFDNFDPVEDIRHQVEFFGEQEKCYDLILFMFNAMIQVIKDQDDADTTDEEGWDCKWWIQVIEYMMEKYPEPKDP